MAVVTRGFGHRRDPDPSHSLPPGQTLVGDWPVLSAGPSMPVPTWQWRFHIETETGERTEWTWDEVRALGVEDVTVDIHCVTHWSKLGMRWKGVPVDRLLAQVETSARYAMAESYGGYTTNLGLEDLVPGRAWIAFEADGKPLSAEHGGPARLLVPHLYFWKSAKWVNGLRMMPDNEPGFWERYGYNLHGDPWKEERYS